MRPAPRRRGSFPARQARRALGAPGELERALEALARNHRRILQRVQAACERAGRDPGDVRVLAVTKSVGPELAARLHELGCRDLAESRAQELERKAAWFQARGLPVRWHFIGPLQRNKARRVLRLSTEIHSVDSIRLLAALERIAGEEGRTPALYLEVKLSSDATKTGLSIDELVHVVRERGTRGLPLAGLMTIPDRLPGAGPEDVARSAADTFTRLADLAATLPAERFTDGRIRLSMGMSRDFEAAIAAGATTVRIGSAFFEGLATASSTAPRPPEERR